MQFGLFGSAAARRGGPEFDSSEGFRDFIEYNIEAEAMASRGVDVVGMRRSIRKTAARPGDPHHIRNEGGGPGVITVF